MTDLSDLIERVRAATGPDNDLCSEICSATGYTSPPVPSPYQGDILGSVDAAISFAGWALPGWVWSVSNDGPRASVQDKPGLVFATQYYDGSGVTAPIAITLATLLAVQATGAK